MASSTNSVFWQIKRSKQPAIILPDGTSINYDQLRDQVDDFIKRIVGDPGPLAILCDGSYRQYVAYLAALNSGCPVLLMGQDQAPEKSSITVRYSYSPKDDDLRRLSDQSLEWDPDLAVLLSTSGSTGSAKWVRLSHANITANANSIAEYLSLTETDRAPMALPFQYSYGMSVINSYLTAGASIALLEGSVVDEHFWRVFAETECTSFAGVPHSFELMERSQVQTKTLKRLRYMTQAGGRLNAETVQRWVERGRTEGWEFFVMYGQTEASPRISYLPPDLALETPSSIGVPVPGGSLWVENETGAILPDGEAGELCYRGANTMMGYAENDSDLAKPQGTDTLKTGDIARRLSNGTFEIVGRMSRFVKLFGLRISLDEVEKQLAKGGLDAVCVTQNDIMYVVVAASKDQTAAVASDLANWLNIPSSSFKLISVEALPRQASGKADLRAVGELVHHMERQAEAESNIQEKAKRGFVKSLLPKRNATVLDIFRTHFPNDHVSNDMSFVSLGGDSLSYVAVSIELEDLLGQLPRDWANMTVSELQAQVAKAKPITWMDTPTLIRALAIMLIVSGHFSLFEYGGGGARALLFIAGISFSTFAIPQIIEQNTIIPILNLSARIAAITFFYTLLNFSVTGYGEWPAFLFIGNWISPSTEGSAWFIEVYLQILALVTLVLLFQPVRSVIARAPFKTIALAACVLVFVAAASDRLFDTNHLFRRLPHLYAWMLFVGMAAGLAQTVMQRLFVTGIFCLGLWQFGGYSHQIFWPVSFYPLAALVLIWVPSLPIPKFATSTFRSIAGASLLIYLSHFQFASVSVAIFGNIPALSWLIAIIGGILAWKIYERLEVSFRILLTARRR